MQSIAVVIPCYKVSAQIFGVLEAIGPEVHKIYVVDDACPQKSGALVQERNRDPRVRVVQLPKNLGVGGATLAGFQAALDDGVQIVIKLDGDGQMNPAFIPALIEPLTHGEADFSKGNRFFGPRYLKEMPLIRLIGNAGISLIAKLTTGYWNVMDTTNGYFAMHTSLLPFLEVQKLEKRYFFENDLLYRLSLLRAVVQDVPMAAIYGDEESNLSVSWSLLTFPWKFLRRFIGRIFYRYFLRDFNAASIWLVLGSVFLGWGVIFGAMKWQLSRQIGVAATSGTVMLAGLPVILGFQMLLSAVLYDLSTVPSRPIHRSLAALRFKATKATAANK